MSEQFFHPLFQAVDSTSLTQLRNNFYRLAVRYAFVRTEWNFMNLPDRAAMDQERTQLHNTMIESLNILAGSVAGAGEDALWQKTPGDERKAIGDFACYVVASLGIRQR